MSTQDEATIFNAARHIQMPDARQAYIEHACVGDPRLQARIESLLRVYDRQGNFLESPADEIAAAVQGSGEGPGTQIGPYKLIEKIGEGGFGVVFMAEQYHPVRRKAAVKILKPGMDSKQVVARFEAERQALALMDHPNIAHVLDGGASASGRPYFVMDLVKGIPINKYCDEHHLTLRERLALFVPVCQAVQHAHQKGIIHRDLKPTNVLVAVYDGEPVPKVIDFGVAKALAEPLTERTLVTGVGDIIGTLEYMSPEQAEFNAHDIDTRSDIYSLGVILYEVLTGTTPLTRERIKQAGVAEALRLIREEEPPRPSNRLSNSKDSLASISAQRKLEPTALPRQVRGDLDWIVMKALDKDRARRYATANGLARDIERYLSDEPVEAGPPSAVYRWRKLVRRNQRLLLTAAAVAIFLLVGAAVSFWQAVLAKAAEKQALAERDAKEAARLAEGEQRLLALKQKERADEEAAVAKAVNEFLQKDLLAQADIANQPAAAQRNKNITVRELLDRSASGIKRRFQAQELTEAAIRLTLGRAYRALAEYPQAQTHLERSYTLRKDRLGPNHPDTLTTMHHLAGMYAAAGKYHKSLSD
jgi:serine/threonine protein kinase